LVSTWCGIVVPSSGTAIIRLLRRFDALADRIGHLAGLADAGADAAAAVADDDDAAEAEPAPPLTTLDTRLIWTTRSSNSPPPSLSERGVAAVPRSRSMLSPPADPALGSAGAVRCVLEDQSALAGAFGDGPHPTVVEEAPPVEDDRVESAFLPAAAITCPTAFARRRLGRPVTGDLADLRFQVAGGDQGVPRVSSITWA
jgi:hypothetical protein